MVAPRMIVTIDAETGKLRPATAEEQVMEFCDRQGWTVRVGDERRKG